METFNLTEASKKAILVDEQVSRGWQWAIDEMLSWQQPDGKSGDRPGQAAHLFSTYASGQMDGIRLTGRGDVQILYEFGAARIIVPLRKNSVCDPPFLLMFCAGRCGEIVNCAKLHSSSITRALDSIDLTAIVSADTCPKKLDNYWN
ncbi:hypothetical protein AX14_006959 [Amanita brunnescens Koide BX004]|nr:hypothetical protein AX14_006959 [Amanita brunnescens Koide BX004]